MNRCSNCGIPLLEDTPGLVCEKCLLIAIKKRYPSVKFLRADLTETNDPDECFLIQGIALKKSIGAKQ